MTTPSHEILREQLLDLAYGELGRREERALRRHLEGCAGCRAELARMTATRSAMSGLSDLPAPERGEGILLAAAREAARARERKPLLPWWVWRATAGAAVAVLLAVVSVRLLEHRAVPGAERSPTDLVAQSPEEPPAAPPIPAKPAARTADKLAAGERDTYVAPGADAGAKAKGDGLLKEEKPREAKVAQEPSRAFATPPPAAPAASGAGKPARSREQPLELHGYSKADVGKKSVGGNDAFARGELKDLDEKEGGRLSEVPAPAAPPAEPPPAAQARAGEDLDQEALALERESDAGDRQAERKSAVAAAPERPAPAPDDDRSASAAVSRSEAGATKSAPAAPKRRAGVASAAGPTLPAARAPEDPVSREARLRAAGGLRVVTRTFAGCPGEAERTVELDEDGTAVKVTRRGSYQGKPYVAELFYGEDGALGVVRWSSEGRVQEFRASPPGASISAAGIPGAAFQPQRAADAGPDAPPRCGP